MIEFERHENRLADKRCQWMILPSKLVSCVSQSVWRVAVSVVVEKKEKCRNEVEEACFVVVPFENAFVV